jgi:hypothetical protein
MSATDLQPWEVHPEDPRINDPELAESMAKVNRRADVSDFEKQTAKDIIAWSKKPEHVQLIEVGDYHYNSWDMEPAES